MNITLDHLDDNPQCQVCGNRYLLDAHASGCASCQNQGLYPSEPHADDCECDACHARFDALMWGWLDDATAARIQRAYESGDIPASMQ